jgi:hypothetical protein
VFNFTISLHLILLINVQNFDVKRTQFTVCGSNTPLVTDEILALLSSVSLPIAASAGPIVLGIDVTQCSMGLAQCLYSVRIDAFGKSLCSWVLMASWGS